MSAPATIDPEEAEMLRGAALAPKHPASARAKFAALGPTPEEQQRNLDFKRKLADARPRSAIFDAARTLVTQ